MYMINWAFWSEEYSLRIRYKPIKYALNYLPPIFCLSYSNYSSVPIQKHELVLAMKWDSIDQHWKQN